ncbi:hypothetical protein HWV62_21320 [Athelia sp. TMB]|nr:hypothetical protein HWV62_21320 [Athelia sp. TMB]
MVAKEWTNLLQKTLLMAWMVRYLEAAATNSYGKFWPAIFEAWFRENKARLAVLPNLDHDDDGDDGEKSASDGEEAPKCQSHPQTDAKKALIAQLRGMTDEGRMAWRVRKGILVDQQRIRTWFRWRQNMLTNDRKGQGKANSSTGAILKKFLHTKDTGRLHSQVHKYSTLFYKTRVGPLVTLELESLGHKPSQAEHLEIIKRTTRETWAQEDEETISMVREALEADRAAKLALGDKKDNVSRTPAEYQQAISDLPSALKAVFEELALKTGWSFSILMGGPYPESGGSIQTASHHVGVSSAGNDFEKAYPEFQSNMVLPFYEFLRYVYPKSVRRERALNVTESSTTSSLSPELPKGAEDESPPPFENVQHDIVMDGSSSFKPAVDLQNVHQPFDDEERFEMDDDPEANSPVHAGHNTKPLVINIHEFLLTHPDLQ